MNIVGKTIFERATQPIANVGHKSVLERATEPLASMARRSVVERAAGTFPESKREEWIRKGLATTGGFVAVSVASAITGAYRRRREGG